MARLARRFQPHDIKKEVLEHCEMELTLTGCQHFVSKNGIKWLWARDCCFSCSTSCCCSRNVAVLGFVNIHNTQCGFTPRTRRAFGSYLRYELFASCDAALLRHLTNAFSGLRQPSLRLSCM